jgi:L-threonylcarbamoyladenylate synthase
MKIKIENKVTRKIQTRVLAIAEKGEAAIAEAAAILRGGGLVAFPTETVYGLGACGLDASAVARIFTAKGRPHSDPLILHVAAPEAVLPLVTRFPVDAALLADTFWPGPLALVLPRSALVPDLVTAGLDSVAVRMPDHPVALDLIRLAGCPLAAPSANLFGRTSPTTAHHVLQDLSGRIDAVLDGGPTRVGVESTVVDLRGEAPILLRPGGVAREALEAVLGRPVHLGAGGADGEGEGPRSPGNLPRHYSPQAPMILFAGTPEAVRGAIRNTLERHPNPVGVIAYSEDVDDVRAAAVDLIDAGPRTDPETIATRLYAALRELDQRGVTLIVAATLPPGGLADAINDRLIRAAAGNVHQV